MDSEIAQDCPFLMVIYFKSPWRRKLHSGKLYKQKIDLLEKEVKV